MIATEILHKIYGVQLIIQISSLGSVQVSFKQSEYLVKESDGKVAITIEASRRNFYTSFYVKIRSVVNTRLIPYGKVVYVSIGYFSQTHLCSQLHVTTTGNITYYKLSAVLQLHLMILKNHFRQLDFHPNNLLQQFTLK